MLHQHLDGAALGTTFQRLRGQPSVVEITVAVTLAVVAQQRDDGALRGTGADPRLARMGLALHLRVDAFSDVVVGTPVGGALGASELVYEMAAPLIGKSAAFGVRGLRVARQMTGATLEFNGCQLLPPRLLLQPGVTAMKGRASRGAK